jgi:hypothetical protein
MRRSGSIRFDGSVMKILQYSLLVLAVGCPFGCTPDSKDGVAGRGSKRLEREQPKLLELASRHAASTDWMLGLPVHGLGKVFTADLKQALVRTNGQPVGFIAELVDVTETNGAYTAHFEMLPFLLFKPRTYFSLRLFLGCSGQQAEELRKVHPEPNVLGMRYAVIARVESVSRPADAGIHLEDEDTMDARGSCVDLLYLERLAKK